MCDCCGMMCVMSYHYGQVQLFSGLVKSAVVVRCHCPGTYSVVVHEAQLFALQVECEVRSKEVSVLWNLPGSHASCAASAL